MPLEGVCSNLGPFAVGTSSAEPQKPTLTAGAFFRNLLPWAGLGRARPLHSRLLTLKSFGINIKSKHNSLCFPITCWITSYRLIPTEKNNSAVSSLPPPSKHCSVQPRYSPKNHQQEQAMGQRAYCLAHEMLELISSKNGFAS